MTERLEMYRCEICGNLVEVILDGAGELVCCGEPMTLLHARNNDSEGLEKHVPVFDEIQDNKTKIRVGSIPHPMVNEHYVMFIEAVSKHNNETHLKYLYPAHEPELVPDLKNIAAREFCNIHGLWEGTNE